MLLHKRVAFSPNSEYFACVSSDNKLLIWNLQNNVFIDCKYDSSVYSACSSLHWIPYRQRTPSPKKAKVTRSSVENQLLAVGTVNGDILLYNVTHKNLFSHFVKRHSDAINDMCYHSETNSLFTCSSDKSIAIWDIPSGKQKSKWKAGDDPVSSIYVIDENNLLSASTSIILWNIQEKKVLKKFSGHSAEIFKLLTVNAVSLNSCYFLSGSVSDRKINAWSLNSNECKTPVASFVLPDQLSDLDISRESSKDKPLMLYACTKDGSIHLFKHVLNGNINQPISPKSSMKVVEKSSSPIDISIKLSSDAENCILAFGSSKDNMTFKHKKIRDILPESFSKNKTLVEKSQDNLPLVLEGKTGNCISVNGIKSPAKCPGNKIKSQLDSVVSNYRRKLRSSSVELSSVETENLSHRDELNTQDNGGYLKVLKTKDPESIVNLLLKGIQTENKEIVEVIFQIIDNELIRKCVEILHSNNLKLVLEELKNRLFLQPSYSLPLSTWLREISEVHLNDVIQSEETTEIAQSILQYLKCLKFNETISKMSALQGLLSLSTEISSSEESSSENDES